MENKTKNNSYSSDLLNIDELIDLAVLFRLLLYKMFFFRLKQSR